MSRKKWHENLKASIRGLLWEEIDVIDGIGGARVTLGLLSSSEVREKGSWALTISAVDIGVRRARIAGDGQYDGEAWAPMFPNEASTQLQLSGGAVPKQLESRLMRRSGPTGSSENGPSNLDTGPELPPCT
ncbi:hypothetical protein C8F01DRAFT_1091051 [Mycena amicta]|nr:hypothetical protein C8F01DRAFT_1091051 [Mycena amicta]